MLGRGGSDQYDCLDTFEVQYFPCLLLGDYCTTQETNHIIDLESSNNCVILLYQFHVYIISIRNDTD